MTTFRDICFKDFHYNAQLIVQALFASTNNYYVQWVVLRRAIYLYY